MKRRHKRRKMYTHRRDRRKWLIMHCRVHKDMKWPVELIYVFETTPNGPLMTSHLREDFKEFSEDREILRDMLLGNQADMELALSWARKDGYRYYPWRGNAKTDLV